MSVGVICHLGNPGPDDVRRLARAAESAGADWVGIPDAFWWRDTWVLLAEAARATDRIALGPVVTNPYLRHPFHTAAAVATLQDLAGPRIFVGIGAGGSEVSGAAGMSRTDAGRRIEDTVRLLHSVAAGGPLDADSDRHLEVALTRPRVLVAGRGAGVLRAGGRLGDDVLLWAIPVGDLHRTIEVVRTAALERPPDAPGPELVWAPLVRHDDATADRIRTIAAYSVLNSSRALQQGWGLDESDVRSLRAALVAGGAAAAAERVPAAALADLVLADPDPAAVAAVARPLGLRSIAVPAFDVASVPERVAWARQVEAAGRQPA